LVIWPKRYWFFGIIKLKETDLLRKVVKLVFVETKGKMLSTV